jgi:hypothetical protein
VLAQLFAGHKAHDAGRFRRLAARSREPAPAIVDPARIHILVRFQGIAQFIRHAVSIVALARPENRIVAIERTGRIEARCELPSRGDIRKRVDADHIGGVRTPEQLVACGIPDISGLIHRGKNRGCVARLENRHRCDLFEFRLSIRLWRWGRHRELCSVLAGWAP